ncbi:phosphoglycolate phosphatase [Pseudaestuariivita sp.]|uniref:phosphoglycolate phosphatase n=1 Tax=Pseudaestuariivita sp. TaxID=2211669 RepID=UPI0040599CAA
MARIVFDLDGTLIDSAPDIQGIANRLLDEAGRAPLSLAETKSFIGNGAPVLIAKMCGARDLPAEAEADLLTAFLARYESAFDLTHPYPGVVEVLAQLGTAHRLGICTNKPKAPTYAVLAHLGLAPHFKVVLGGDSLPQRKPDPAPLRAAFDALGAGPCIYVGDSEVDAETARRAGVPFLLFTHGYRKSEVSAIPHTAAFDDWSAVPALVAGLT